MNELPVRPHGAFNAYDEPLWQSAAKHALALQRCDECGRYRYPSAVVCPHCLSFSCSWTEISGRGWLEAWTVIHKQYFPSLETPYCVCVVEIDEGPLLIGNVPVSVVDTLRLKQPMQIWYEDVIYDNGEQRTLFQWRPVAD
jgi:uncharacterized OB-fold protein